MEFMYNWDNNPKVITYLEKIYYNILEYLKDNDYNEKYANEFINDIEDFIYYFKRKGYNVNHIIDKINDIESIEFYDSLYIDSKRNNEELIPPVMNRGTKILLSTYISSDKRLTSKERRRLYLYQGLARSLFSYKTSKTLLFSKIYTNYLPYDHTAEIIVNNGWLVLEETLAQELAEKITYRTIDKIRPGYRPGLDNEIYPLSGHKISSNLEMYRIFQELVVHFGLTINKIDNIYDYSEKTVLNNMIKYSIESDFSSIAIFEYREKDKMLELYQILYLMGILINEKYRTYHMNFIRNNLTIEDIDKIYDNIISFLDTQISLDNNKQKDDNVIILYDYKIKEKIRKLIQNHEI